jgi:hypothetical protein
MPVFICQICKPEHTIEVTGSDVEVEVDARPGHIMKTLIPDPEIFSEEQIKDHKLSSIINNIETRSQEFQLVSTNDERFTEQLSQLKIKSVNILVRIARGKHQIVVPTSLQKNIFDNYHSMPHSGHYGFKKH